MASKYIIILFLLGFSSPAAEGISWCVDIPKIPFPYQVLVRNRKKFDDFCGGTILNDRYVLTTPTCLRRAGINNPHEGEVVAGIFYRTRWIPRQRTRSILKINNHPSFVHMHGSDTNFHAHDLAMIQILSLGKFDENVNQIGIGSYIHYGKRHDILGWGMTSNSSMTDDLRFATLSPKNYDWCRRNLASSGRAYFKKDMLCAVCYYPWHGPLRRDEGGALVLKGLAYGIYLWRIEDDPPPVFMDLTKYRKWIVSFGPTPASTTPKPTTTTTTTRKISDLVQVSRGCSIRIHDLRLVYLAYVIFIAVL